MNTLEKVNLNSKDVTEETIEELKKLIPSAFKDGKIDFDTFKSVLGDIVEPNQEYYNFTWAGKSEAFRIIKEKTTATLKPMKSDEESVDFKNTENIFIEGDNLEVLKILQKTYHNAIKMIYIDPPYNKDKDFVYPDKWSEGLNTYLEYAKLVDEEGNITSSSAEEKSVKAGRKHSRWLTMMYPRLFLARNLLKEDGVIFISIDDIEVKNLKMICDEIFGEENFEGHIHWRRRHNQPNDKTKMIGLVAEHILVYYKDKESYKKSGVGKLDLTGDFSNPDNDERGDWASKPWKVGSDQSGSKYSITTPTGKIFNEEWMGEQSTFRGLLEDNRIIFTNKGNGLPRKKYFRFEREEEGQSATNWWNHDKFGHNQEANDEVTNLFDGNKNLFSNPKPTKLIDNLINLANLKDEDVVMDFFAGSGSTAHSSLIKNIKFITVQLPEHIDKKYQDTIDFLNSINKPTNIAEITKERIRRAGKKIKEEHPESEIDTGFKVFKLSESNFKQWDENIGSIEQLQQAFDFYKENVKEGTEQFDMLYEVILAKGLSLNSKVEVLEVGDKKIFKVDSEGELLLVYFEDEIIEGIIDEVIKINPISFICLDSSFKNNSSLKTNSVLRLRDANILFETV